MLAPHNLPKPPMVLNLPIQRRFLSEAGIENATRSSKITGFCFPLPINAGGTHAAKARTKSAHHYNRHENQYCAGPHYPKRSDMHLWQMLVCFYLTLRQSLT